MPDLRFGAAVLGCTLSCTSLTMRATMLIEDLSGYAVQTSSNTIKKSLQTVKKQPSKSPEPRACKREFRHCQALAVRCSH